MKEITSKKTGHTEIVTEEVYADIVARGWAKKYEVTELAERKLKEVPKIIPPEVKTKTKHTNDNTGKN
jgi:hypothetical protein